MSIPIHYDYTYHVSSYNIILYLFLYIYILLLTIYVNCIYCWDFIRYYVYVYSKNRSHFTPAGRHIRSKAICTFWIIYCIFGKDKWCGTTEYKLQTIDVLLFKYFMITVFASGHRIAKYALSRPGNVHTSRHLLATCTHRTILTFIRDHKYILYYNVVNVDYEYLAQSTRVAMCTYIDTYKYTVKMGT